jgi:hypothetical protein
VPVTGGETDGSANPASRSGRRYGRRRTYLVGVLVFTAASLACALAPDRKALIGFRFVQGAGAAVLVPQVFSIIQLTFTGPARARALSVQPLGSRGPPRPGRRQPDKFGHDEGDEGDHVGDERDSGRRASRCSRGRALARPLGDVKVAVDLTR